MCTVSLRQSVSAGTRSERPLYCVIAPLEPLFDTATTGCQKGPADLHESAKHKTSQFEDELVLARREKRIFTISSDASAACILEQADFLFTNPHKRRCMRWKLIYLLRRVSQNYFVYPVHECVLMHSCLFAF